ncbi:hypothetical protein K466DRAFT_240020 [Polyporus arcularius HHB13444]|uniref:Uncharacterized protein n=1 Tax=Polyporus arcularius HHB13444 TaxID=1314778 RepID=A0A5C3P429_9APHY|nr:hypothetical protein K466DRAFT_240020 [Polyporus arcularius HHB13444]
MQMQTGDAGGRVVQGPPGVPSCNILASCSNEVRSTERMLAHGAHGLIALQRGALGAAQKLSRRHNLVALAWRRCHLKQPVQLRTTSVFLRNLAVAREPQCCPLPRNTCLSSEQIFHPVDCDETARVERDGRSSPSQPYTGRRDRAAGSIRKTGTSCIRTSTAEATATTETDDSENGDIERFSASRPGPNDENAEPEGEEASATPVW